MEASGGANLITLLIPNHGNIPTGGSMAEVRTIIRIAGFDLDGTKPVYQALRGIKGVGHNLARMLSYIIKEKFNISPSEPLGLLPPEADKTLEDIVRNPTKYGIPGWAVNSPRDIESGKDTHYIGTDLETHIITVKKHLLEIGTRRGIRLARGLKVRGQRTRSHPRRNKISVVGRKRR